MIKTWDDSFAFFDLDLFWGKQTNDVSFKPYHTGTTAVKTADIMPHHWTKLDFVTRTVCTCSVSKWPRTPAATVDCCWHGLMIWIFFRLRNINSASKTLMPTELQVVKWQTAQTVELHITVVTLSIMTYLFVVRVGDDQKGVVWPRQEIFTCFVPGYSVDLRRRYSKIRIFISQFTGLVD